MNNSAATASTAGRTRGAGPAPLYRAVQQAARNGPRRSFALRAGLTTAELVMVERAIGVHLAA